MNMQDIDSRKKYWFTGLLGPFPADRFNYNTGYNAYPGIPNYYTYFREDDPSKKAYLEKEKRREEEKRIL